MVVGKAGDTSKTTFIDSAAVSPQILRALDTVKEFKTGRLNLPKQQIQNFDLQEQSADGIIATCKTSVDIAINLIGIMALFMGF